MFYCMKCEKIHGDSEAITIFSTGYRRLNGVDYHLGKCRKASTCTANENVSENNHLIKASSIGN